MFIPVIFVDQSVVETPPPFERQRTLPFAKEIAAFQTADRKKKPDPGQILFIGSSTFTKWTDVADYFPTHHILNRAFGGSTFQDQIRYVRQTVFPYKPCQIVIYCGENDFGNDPNLSPDDCTARLVTLFRLIRNHYPNVPIIYISMKPSPSRWPLKNKFIAANRWIATYLKNQRNSTFVDVWPVMLNENGLPKPEIFLPDQLHMNAIGYHLWQPLIEPLLKP
jgi:lysophospholipase L1-like esterase